MPWWDYVEPGSGGSDYYQQQAQQSLARWQANFQASQREKDNDNILSWIGDKAGGAVDKIGDFGEDLITQGLHGLDWYDRNIVGNVWDYGLRYAVASAVGKDPNSLKYEELPLWGRLAAGVVADPLTYLGGMGAAAKGLKAGAQIRGLQNTAKALGAVEKGINVTNAATMLPFTLAGKGIKAAVLAPQHIPGGTGAFFKDVFAGMGQETAESIATRHGIAAWLNLGRALEDASKHVTGTSLRLSEISPDSAREILADIHKRGSEFQALTRRGQSAAPLTDAEDAIYRILQGGMSTTKRQAENLRRILSPKLWSPYKWTPEVGQDVDDILQEVIHGAIDDITGLGLIADKLNLKHVADDVFMGNGLPAESMVDSLTWLQGRKTSPITALAGVGKDAKNSDELLRSFQNQVYAHSKGELSRGTQLARDYMGKRGDFANHFDPMYRKVWTNGLDKYLIRPVTEMVLGFPFFVVGNVIEDISMSMLGGKGWTKTRWRVGVDEFQNWAHEMPPNLAAHLPASLWERPGANTFALQGSHDAGQGLSKLNEGIGGYVFGGKLLKSANNISADIRRSYYMTRLEKNLINAGFGPALERLKAAKLPEGLEERARQVLLMTAADPAATPEKLRAMILAGGTESEAVKQVIMSGSLTDGEAKTFLLNNLDGLAKPESREKILREAYTLHQKDIAHNMELVLPEAAKYIDGFLKDLPNITSTDDLVAHLNGLFDAHTVAGELSRYYRAEGGRLAGKVSEAAQHAHNLEYLKKTEKLREKVESGFGAGLEGVVKKLQADGRISGIGVERLTELSKKVQQLSNAYKTRQAELLRIRVKDGDMKAWQLERNKVFDTHESKIQGLVNEVHDLRTKDIDQWFVKKSPGPQGSVDTPPTVLGDASFETPHVMGPHGKPVKSNVRDMTIEEIEQEIEDIYSFLEPLDERLRRATWQERNQIDQTPYNRAGERKELLRAERNRRLANVEDEVTAGTTPRYTKPHIMGPDGVPVEIGIEEWQARYGELIDSSNKANAWLRSRISKAERGAAKNTAQPDTVQSVAQPDTVQSVAQPGQGPWKIHGQTYTDPQDAAEAAYHNVSPFEPRPGMKTPETPLHDLDPSNRKAADRRKVIDAQVDDEAKSAAGQIRQRTQDFGDALGTASAKARESGKRVVVRIRADDNFGARNFAVVRELINRQVKAATELGNVMFVVEGDNAYAQAVRKLLKGKVAVITPGASGGTAVGSRIITAPSKNMMMAGDTPR